MKSRPCVRKVVKWGGVVVTLLLAVVWIGSRWAGVREVIGSDVIVLINGGAIYLTTMGPKEPWLIYGMASPPRWTWDFFGKQWSGDFTYAMPLWPLVVLVAAGTLLLWCWDARCLRRAHGMCAGCGYDRAGLASGAVCPECGK